MFGGFKIVTLLYADDVILLSESAEGLQRGLDCMYEYCNTWRLKLNVNKSKIVIFKIGRRRMNESWFYGDSELNVSNEMSYLGLMFSCGGALTRAQNTLAEQAFKATFSLFTYFYKFSHISPIVKY